MDEMHREPRQLRRGQGCYPENGLRVSGRRSFVLEPELSTGMPVTASQYPGTAICCGVLVKGKIERFF